MKVQKLTGLLLALSWFISGCDTSSSTPDNFDRASLLIQIDAMIAADFQNLETEISAMGNAVSAFQNQPDSASLATVKARFVNLYLAYQSTAWLNFGPGESVYGNYIQKTNIYPTDTATIISQLANPDPDGAFSRRGFPALEFLLSHETDLVNNSAWRNMQLAVWTDLKQSLQTLQSEWAAYQAEFLSETGTSVGSSTSLYYNNLLQNYENLVMFKVALPGGYYVNAPGSDPKLAEGYHGAHTLDYLEENLHAIHAYWYGGTGLGMDDYLAASSFGNPINASLESKWEAVFTLLENKPAHAIETVLSQHPQYWSDLHQALRSLIPHMKSETSSALGIAITFTDADGD